MFGKGPYLSSRILLAALFVALILVGPAAAASRKAMSPSTTVNDFSAAHRAADVSSNTFFRDWTKHANTYFRKVLSRLHQDRKTLTVESVRDVDLCNQNCDSLSLNELISVAEPLLVPGFPSAFLGIATIGGYATQHEYRLPLGIDGAGFPQLKHFATQLERALEALQGQEPLDWKTLYDVISVPPPSPETIPILDAAQKAVWRAKLALLQRRLPQAQLDIGQAKQYLTVYEGLVPEALRQIAFELTAATYIAERNVTGDVGIKATHSQERTGRTIERQASRPGWWSDLSGRFKRSL